MTMPCLQLYIIDAFASEPFTGNPAAVCLLDQKLSLEENEKQDIAAEMNQSETAFLQPLKPGESFENASEFKLQWFTPVMEVNLCGHATLASAAAVFKVKGNRNDCLVFHTKSGRLLAKRKGQAVAINLPLNPCTTELPTGADEIVKLSVGSYSPVDVQYAPGANTEILIRLPDTISRGEFESISPDLAGLMDIYDRRSAPGVILTVKGGSGTGSFDEHGRHFDFLSRYFDPWNGIPEDPVTGAAHCVLAGYWSHVLGRTSLYARQCSKRGGNIEVEVLDGGRVELTGTASVMFKGKIHL